MLPSCILIFLLTVPFLVYSSFPRHSLLLLLTSATPRCWHPSMISCEGSNGVTPCPALLALLRDLARSLHAVGPHVSSCPDTSYGSAAPLPQPPETFLDASMTVSPLPISQPVNVVSSIASLRIQASQLNLLTREANGPL